MATAYTCTTPVEGWGLYNHFLGNILLLIGLQGHLEENETEEEKEKRERLISERRAELVGYLYIIRRRIEAAGHKEEGDKMQQVLDMVTDLDVTNFDVREAIHNKVRELDPNTRRFEDEVVRLRAEAAAARIEN